MPELQGRIVKEALWLEAELKQFHKKPENLAEFTKLATAVKNDVEREFQKQMGDVSSRLDTVELEKRCVGSLIRGLFETTFRRDIELSSAIDDIQIRYKILMAKENTNGVRDSMFTSAKVLETIVEEQVSRLSLPVENIVSTVVDQLEGTISNLIRSLPRMGQFPVLQRFACAKSIEELQRNKEKALDFINLRILIEKGYVGTKQRLIQDHYDKEDKVVWQKDDGKASYENRIYRKIRLERDQLRLEEPHHAEHDDEREKSIDLRECTVRIYRNDHKKVELIHHRHNSEPNYVSFDMDGEDVQKLISKFCRVGFYPKLEDGGRVERDEEELKRAEDQDIRQVEVVYDMIREYMDVVIRSIWSDVMKTVITLIINQQVVFFKSDFLSDLINEGMKLTEESADAARNRKAKQKRYQLCKGILGITKQLMHQTE
ncbi:hypothetical protein L596_017689 [Steinernema carpocapsae]|uniref:dynamin GTPase n=1 Tax=Steinernema carpocapsae TaxID=34508 RepID=A0A4U5N2S1_STECR|nr:hypothetical protein L596_017689 [Steinernema carpocapsae]